MLRFETLKITQSY